MKVDAEPKMAKISFSVLVLILLFASAAESRTDMYPINNEEFDTTDGVCKTMVEKQGYACQEHQVTTKDGYILSMQRISKSGAGEAPDKPPVLLQHGLFMDGVTWLLNPPDQALAFVLADNGYDVWVANTRGTKYSRGHTSLSPYQSDYWDWSWDELVADDLPATLQYVSDQTGQKPHYVGHSLGTLIALAALTRGELVNMFRSAALLSPIAYLNQIPSLLARAASEIFLTDLYWLGIREFNPRGEAAARLLGAICNVPGTDCADLMTAFTGPNCCLNSSNLDGFWEHEPQSTATKNLVHIAQMVRNGNIAMFNYYNIAENIRHYGQAVPPAYDMTKIPNDVPLFLSYGGRDTLSDVNDVQILLGNLKDHDGDKLVVQYIEDYAHVDFFLAVNAKQVVYDPLMAFFKLH